MKRIWSHAITLLALGLATSAVAPACVENNESMFIRNIVAPPASQGGACTYKPDPTGAALMEGVLDVGIRDDYYGVMLVGSQMIGRGDQNGPRAESNRVALTGATSKVTNLDGSVIREFTSYGTGFVEIQSSNSPSYGIFGAPLIDKPTRDVLAASLPNRVATRTVLANVKVFGKSLGGVDVETGEFQFPIRVCNGCLVDFSTGNDPAIQPSPNCAKPQTAAGATTTAPCIPGQDVSTPCQLCVGRPACTGGP